MNSAESTFLIWISRWPWVILTQLWTEPGQGIVKKQTIDNVLDVIIIFIYWELHM